MFDNFYLQVAILKPVAVAVRYDQKDMFRSPKLKTLSVSACLCGVHGSGANEEESAMVHFNSQILGLTW